MNTIPHMQLFMDDAIRGGWEAPLVLHNPAVWPMALLDVNAWKAVAKTRGWGDTTRYYPPTQVEGQPPVHYQYKGWAHKMIDVTVNLVEGDDIEKALAKL